MNFKHIKALKKLRQSYPEFNGEEITSYCQRLLKVNAPIVSLGQVNYNPEWPTWFSNEKFRLLESSNILDIVDVQQIGSTAIPGMKAKNIIDIACVINNSPNDKSVIHEMKQLDYKFYGNSPINRDAYWFWSFKVQSAYVVHLCKLGNPCFNIPFAFRDYLSQHPEERESYALKKKMLSLHSDNLFAYSIEKVAILCELFERANKWRKRRR